MIRRLALLGFVTAMVLVPVGAAAGGGCIPDPGLELTSSSRRSVAIANCAFVDTVTYVDTGETVRWVNEDYVPHTVTGAALSWGDEEFLDQGEKVSHTFDEEGVYPYYCDLHPSMVGAVVVGDGKGAIAAPVSDTSPVDPEGGTSTAVVALAGAAGLAALVLAGRYVLGRRTTPAPTR